jgi:hypothetical protein
MPKKKRIKNQNQRNQMRDLLMVLLVLVATSTYGQVKLEGVVKDSIGNPLELANVVAINKATNILDSYAITNDLGKFRLDLEKNSAYKIQVSYIGMITYEDQIETKETKLTRDFTLQNDTALDEVELVYEMPVTIKGDTIVYNADSFKNGTERKLEDVLKKLPGVEINSDGEIEIEGKKVSKVMVEGKDFFDGDSKLATQNIPANAVDKVQVLKNHSEIGQLSGVTNNEDNIAINIKLKEGKKNFWFGTVTAGSGVADNEGLYLTQPKLFYYSPKYSVNVIGDLNNIGERVFTRRDYFNFTGGFKLPSQSSGTNINLGDNGLGFLILQNDRAKEINTKFGAANFSYSPNKALDISGFSIFSSSRIKLQENTERLSTVGQRPDETIASSTNQSSDLGMLKLSTKYKPNADNQLDYDILARLSKESHNQNVYSSILKTISENEETKPYTINQNLNYYYTLNTDNIFSFEAHHQLKDEDPFYNAFIEQKTVYQPTAISLGLDEAQEDYTILQEKRVKSNKLDAKLDYWNVLNAKSNINLTLGTILSHQKFNSEIFQQLDNNSAYQPTPVINNGVDTNDTKYNFSDLYLGVHYRFKTGMFTFTPGVSGHAYSSKNEQLGETYKDDFFRLLPDFTMRMQLKKSEQIILNYRMQTQFTDVTQLASGLVLNNYNALYSGNPELESALSHLLNLSYFSFNLFNYTNVFGNVTYSKNTNAIRSNSVIAPGSVINYGTSFNSNFADETLAVRGRFQRTFGKLKASLGGTFNYSKFNQFRNDNAFTSENYSQNYNAELSTNYRDAPNFNLKYSLGIQDNAQNGTRFKYYTHAPSVEFDALIFKTLTFKTDFTFNDFRNEEESINKYQFWNASLGYRKDSDSNSKWEYELIATNLLDTKSQNNSSNSNDYISTTEYFIQQRFLTFRAIYNL